ncbi:MAG: response regulator [Elusimicrobiota bacterium]
MGKRVLVIEDEPGYQDLMRFVLGGYELSVYGSVEEAERDHPDGDFDLVISDINLAGASGFDFLQRWIDKGRAEKIPFILWSSNNSDETRQKAMEMGAAGFITKPFKTEAVQKMVETLLSTAPS